MVSVKVSHLFTLVLLTCAAVYIQAHEAPGGAAERTDARLPSATKPQTGFTAEAGSKSAKEVVASHVKRSEAPPINAGDAAGKIEKVKKKASGGGASGTTKPTGATAAASRRRKRAETPAEGEGDAPGKKKTSGVGAGGLTKPVGASPSAPPRKRAEKKQQRQKGGAGGSKKPDFKSMLSSVMSMFQ